MNDAPGQNSYFCELFNQIWLRARLWCIVGHCNFRLGHFHFSSTFGVHFDGGRGYRFQCKSKVFVFFLSPNFFVCLFQSQRWLAWQKVLPCCVCTERKKKRSPLPSIFSIIVIFFSFFSNFFFFFRAVVFFLRKLKNNFFQRRYFFCSVLWTTKKEANA